MDSAALRYSGLTNPTIAGQVVTMDVESLTISGPNVPDFSGPGVTPPPVLVVPRLIADSNTLMLDGTALPGGTPASAGPFEATGVNKPSTTCTM